MQRIVLVMINVATTGARAEVVVVPGIARTVAEGERILILIPLFGSPTPRLKFINGKSWYGVA